jgi:hypothetical protein
MLIENLSHELDTKSMTAVRGGTSNSNANSSLISQVMNAPVSVIGGAVNGGNVDIDIKPSQWASNYTDQYAGNATSLGYLFPVYSL